MKRRELIRYLEKNGATVIRQGKHTIYQRSSNTAAVPRHAEIATLTAYSICDDLGIPRPAKK